MDTLQLGRTRLLVRQTPRSVFELTIERRPNGEVSPYLPQEVEVGDRLELRGPISGRFAWRIEQTEPIQLVARSSGIEPFWTQMSCRHDQIETL
jgi:ferredoxin-NADP reductase